MSLGWVFAVWSCRQVTILERGVSCTHPGKQEVIRLDQGFPLLLCILSQSSAQGLAPMLLPARRGQTVRSEMGVLPVAEFALKIVLLVFWFCCSS